MRASVELLEDRLRPGRDQPILAVEKLTPMFAHLAGRFPNLAGCEFLGDAVPLGAVNDRGVRNEDLTRLTFADGSFDHLLCFEVFEHVPDFAAAFAECGRVLRPGGRMLFSAPFAADRQRHLIRAAVREDGSVEHLLPAEYHGDPLSDAGCLCFQHFGWDLLDDLRAAGFSDAVALHDWSRESGHLGADQIQFIATK